MQLENCYFVKTTVVLNITMIKGDKSDPTGGKNRSSFASLIVNFPFSDDRHRGDMTYD